MVSAAVFVIALWSGLFGNAGMSGPVKGQERVAGVVSPPVTSSEDLLAGRSSANETRTGQEAQEALDLQKAKEALEDAGWGDVLEVRVTVVEEESGAPIPGAYLVQSRYCREELSDLEPPTIYAARTDETGEALIQVRGAARYVAAIKLGVGMSPFVALGRQAVVRIELSELDGVVAGLVLDHTGRGVEGATVRLSQRQPARAPGPDGSNPSNVRLSTLSGVDGAFSFRASRSWGRCVVRATSGRSVSRASSTDPFDESSSHLRIEMPGRYLLRGQVLNWKGKPGVNVLILAHGDPNDKDPEGESASARSDAAGGFEIPLLTGGRYTVTPAGEPESPGGKGVTVSLSDDGPAYVVLHTDEPAQLTVKVRGGRKGERVRIAAMPVGEGWQAGRQDGETMDDKGVVLQNLRRGMEYEVMALSDTKRLASVRAIAGIDASVELVTQNLQGNASLGCTLSGDGLSEGTAPMKLSVRAWAGNGAELSSELAKGEGIRGSTTEFRGLPEVSVVVVVATSDGAEIARSAPVMLGDVPVLASLDVPAMGSVELLSPVIAEGAMVFARILYADGSPLMQRGASRLQPAVPARWDVPAGRYVMNVTCQVGETQTRTDLPFSVLAGDTTRLRY
ncbi:MAG: carboxypeptidase-like regulatory domain-containing protein [Planctomycetota bacterium]